MALVFGTAFATLIEFIFSEKTKSVFGVSVNRSLSAMFALGAMQDIFLAYNMFFILDDSRRPDIIRDEGRQISYAV